MPDAMNVLDSIADLLAELLLIELHLKNRRRGDETNSLPDKLANCSFTNCYLCIYPSLSLVYGKVYLSLFSLTSPSRAFHKKSVMNRAKARLCFESVTTSPSQTVSLNPQREEESR